MLFFQKIFESVLNVKVPPFPRVISLALVVFVFNGQFAKQSIELDTAFKKIVAIATPHIDLGEGDSTRSIGLCKRVYVVARAAKLLCCL